MHDIRDAIEAGLQQPTGPIDTLEQKFHADHLEIRVTGKAGTVLLSVDDVTLLMGLRIQAPSDEQMAPPQPGEIKIYPQTMQRGTTLTIDTTNVITMTAG